MWNYVIPLGGMMTGIIIVIGMPLARAYARSVELRQHAPAGETETIARLDRIEQAVEAMATQVERIAEGQRFTTKLLSAAPAAPMSAAAQPAREPVAAAASVPEGTILTNAARRE